jgi:hypothetical protein
MLAILSFCLKILLVTFGLLISFLLARGKDIMKQEELFPSETVKPFLSTLSSARTLLKKGKNRLEA